MKFSLFGIPIAIEWWFWLVTALLGGGLSAQSPEDWTEVLVWMMVVFISITVHELGHAFAGRHYGASPYIRLHGFGGVTFLPGTHFTRGQNIAVSAAGPAAGLTLGAVVWCLDKTLTGMPRMVDVAFYDAMWVNFVWTLVNLLPIQPLDGGQILGQVLGPSRVRVTSTIGFIVAAGCCVWAISRGMLFSAMMLAMLAYYNLRREPVEGGVVTQ